MALTDALLIRGNIIRHADNGSDTRLEPSTPGITCVTARGALIEENLLENKRVFQGGDLRPEVLVSRDVYSFRNRSPDGELIHAYDTNTREYSEQLEDRVELGLILALC